MMTWARKLLLRSAAQAPAPQLPPDELRRVTDSPAWAVFTHNLRTRLMTRHDQLSAFDCQEAYAAVARAEIHLIEAILNEELFQGDETGRGSFDRLRRMSALIKEEEKEEHERREHSRNRNADAG